MSWAVWYPGVETTQGGGAPPANPPKYLNLMGCGRGIVFILSFLYGVLHG